MSEKTADAGASSSTPATTSTSPSSATSSSAAKTLFQIDYSFLGKNKFQHKSKRPNSADSVDNPANTINTNVYSIRLNRLIKTENKNIQSLVKQRFGIKRTRDLVHTICALYDNSLPDIGAQSIYDCICSPKSFTICVVKDEPQGDDPPSDQDSQSLYGSNDDLRTLENLKDYPESIFTNLFSDDDESNEDDDDETPNTKVDFTYGVKTFIEHKKLNGNEPKSDRLLKNLIAIATIQKTSTYQLPGQDEWVIDLELMSVRSKYRGLNIGKYLINLIQNKDYVGSFDAIVTSSDLDAIKFYEKYGFNIDPILNSKYKFIGDIWTNTTKMCYIPPYCRLIDKHQTQLKEVFTRFNQKPLIKSIESLDNDDDNQIVDEVSFDNLCVAELTSMENDFKRWQKLMFSAYQSQAQIFFKLKQEITNLKIKLSAKESIIGDLKIQNELLSKNNNQLKMKMGKNLEMSDQLKFTNNSNIEESKCDSNSPINENEEIHTDLDKLIADLKVLSQKKNF